MSAENHLPDYPNPQDESNIVIIGGGGGTAAVFPTLTRVTKNAIAVFGVTDSGGSTGRLSDELDIAPIGDARNIMMAASLNPEIVEMRRHRFAGEGPLRGHTVGNLVLAAYAADPHRNLQEAMEHAQRFLQVPGRILPVSLQRGTLVMEDGQGNIIRGEHKIDEYHTTSEQPRVWIEPAKLGEPDVTINPSVQEAIEHADLIVIPGGSVYTSLLAALCVGGVREALHKARAPKVLLSNLATEQHQTDGWHVANYVQALQRHGIDVDVVLYNNQSPSPEMIDNYAREGERPVDYSPGPFALIPTVRAIGAALLADEMAEHNPLDPLKRGLMRHNAAEVVRQLCAIKNEYISLRAETDAIAS